MTEPRKVLPSHRRPIICRTLKSYERLGGLQIERLLEHRVRRAISPCKFVVEEGDKKKGEFIVSINKSAAHEHSFPKAISWVQTVITSGYICGGPAMIFCLLSYQGSSQTLLRRLTNDRFICTNIAMPINHYCCDLFVYCCAQQTLYRISFEPTVPFNMVINLEAEYVVPRMHPIQPFADQIWVIGPAANSLVINFGAMLNMSEGEKRSGNEPILQSKDGRFSTQPFVERLSKHNFVINLNYRALRQVPGLIDPTLWRDPKIYAVMVDHDQNYDANNARRIRPLIARHLSRDIVTEILNSLIRFSPL